MKRTLAALAPIGSATHVREVIAADDVKSRLVDLGGVPHASKPAQFAQMIDADRKRYAQIIRERKISID